MSFNAAILPGDRLHLQHGPIDLVIGADGARAAAFAAAQAGFAGVLEGLVAELDLLRRDGWWGETPPYGVTGSVAQRMVRAVARHQRFVTPMAAVAGAVADHVLAAMVEGPELRRAYVNNGGDIAVCLGDGARFRLAVQGLDGNALGAVEICHADGIGGVATSGRGGRSQSMGIADSVTVLARDAASADVAATLIGNAVDLPGHEAVRRMPADALRPDSDLGTRLVVADVGALTPGEVTQALDRGKAAAEGMRADGMIRSAALFLRGRSCVVGEVGFIETREAEYA